MGGFHKSLPDNLAEWILQQKVFWVATAPLATEGHVNVSPRGHDCFNIVSPNSAYFVDMTGSGSETMSHLNEPGNGRITILFNAFEGPPRIVRLYGKGKIFERGSPEFDKLLPPGDERILPGTRCIVYIDFDVVGYSCGYTVPFMEYISDRDTLKEWARPKIEADERGDIHKGLQAYWALKNFESVDGLPSLKLGIDFAQKGIVKISEKDREPLRIQRLASAVTSKTVKQSDIGKTEARQRNHSDIFLGFLIGIAFVIAWNQLSPILVSCFSERTLAT